MGDYLISRPASRMAWKMVRTIFDQYALTPSERDELLGIATLLSLRDLLDSLCLEWTSDPPQGGLSFQGSGIAVGQAGANPEMRRRIGDRLIDRLYDRSEEILDGRDVPDLERSALFAALPCLGLQALSPHLKWLKPPPFAED